MNQIWTAITIGAMALHGGLFYGMDNQNLLKNQLSPIATSSFDTLLETTNDQDVHKFFEKNKDVFVDEVTTTLSDLISSLPINPIALTQKLKKKFTIERVLYEYLKKQIQLQCEKLYQKTTSQNSLSPTSTIPNNEAYITFLNNYCIEILPLSIPIIDKLSSNLSIPIIDKLSSNLSIQIIDKLSSKMTTKKEIDDKIITLIITNPYFKIHTKRNPIEFTNEETTMIWNNVKSEYEQIVRETIKERHSMIMEDQQLTIRSKEQLAYSLINEITDVPKVMPVSLAQSLTEYFNIIPSQKLDKDNINLLKDLNKFIIRHIRTKDPSLEKMLKAVDKGSSSTKYIDFFSLRLTRCIFAIKVAPHLYQDTKKNIYFIQPGKRKPLADKPL